MSAAEDATSDYMALRDLRTTQARRGRVLVVVSGIVIALIFLYWGVFFAFHGEWVIFGVDFVMVWVCAFAGVLATRGGLRLATAILAAGVIVVVLCIAIFLDLPTAAVPRSAHHYLIPVAVASYLILRGGDWLAHAIAFFCLTAVVILDSSNFGIPNSHALPDDIRRVGTWINNVTAMAVLYLLVHVFVGDINKMESFLHRANNRFVDLVGGMFPRTIAERLLGTGESFAERHADCSVLFADIVGFTGLSERLRPEVLVKMLSEIFARFDQCVEQHGLTKIKTIGDAYMVAAGVPEPNPDHARLLVVLARQMLEAVREVDGIELRVGIASGELVAGVIGKSRQIYDVWGDVVNMASRMESHGLPGRIQVSASCHALVKPFFEFEKRAGVTIKGKGGSHDIYLLRTGDVPVLQA